MAHQRKEGREGLLEKGYCRKRGERPPAAAHISHHQTAAQTETPSRLLTQRRTHTFHKKSHWRKKKPAKKWGENLQTNSSRSSNRFFPPKSFKMNARANLQGDQLSLQRKKRAKLNLFGLSSARPSVASHDFSHVSLFLLPPTISQPFFNRGGGRSRPRAKMGRHEQPSPNRSFFRSDLPEPERKKTLLGHSGCEAGLVG